MTAGIIKEHSSLALLLHTCAIALILVIFSFQKGDAAPLISMNSMALFFSCSNDSGAESSQEPKNVADHEAILFDERTHIDHF